MLRMVERQEMKLARLHAALIMAGFAASVSLLVRHWAAILAWQAAEPDLAPADARQPLLAQVCCCAC